MSTNTEINKELVDWAYANLKNIPKGIEYEKMISSIPYDCFDKDLFMARNLSHERALDYGNIRMKDYDFDMEKHTEARFQHLDKIFGRIPKDFFIEPPFFVDYGCNIKFGERCYANFNVTFLDCTLITFGDDVLIGPNVTFTTATHPLEAHLRKNGVEYAHPINVGSGVWFAANVVVLPGVNIGDNCVIGAGSVVTKDVPPNSLVLGVPGKVVKTITDKVKEAAEVGAI